MTFGSLFAGIGGFDLGLERAGLTCSWQVEIDPYARRVLERHWPDVRRWDDVRTFSPADGDWGVDVICGGFPCQDISNAGKRAGINGERSGLWSEFARIIGELRPRYVLVENVPEVTLPGRGLSRILGDLAEMGLDAEWACLEAAAFGAPHPRDRFWLVAYPQGSTGIGRRRRRKEGERRPAIGSAKPSGSDGHGNLPQARVFGPGREIAALPRPCWGADKPGVARASHGVPHRMDRIRGIGNAVVPAVAEWLGRRLIEADTSTHEGVAG